MHSWASIKVVLTPDEQTAIAVLDSKITEATAELERIDQNRPHVVARLELFRAARSALEHDSKQDDQGQRTLDTADAPSLEIQPAQLRTGPEERPEDRLVLGSIGWYLLECLRANNGQAFLGQILAYVREHKDRNITPKTLSAIVSQYVRKGILRHLGPGNYELASGSHPHALEVDPAAS